MAARPSEDGAAPLVFEADARGVFMTRWVQVAFLLIATNAVLIQTIATDDSPIKNAIRIGVLVITAFFMFVRQTVFPAAMVFMLLATAILLLGTGNTDQFTILYVLLFVPAMWSISERSLWRAGMIASVFALLLVFVFLRLGLTANELVISQNPLADEVRSRNTFGTQGVPFFMNLVYGAVTMTIFYLYKWRIRGRLVVAAIGVAVATYLFIQTDGRGGYIAIWFFIAFALIMRGMVKISFFRPLLAIQPILMLGVSLLLAAERNSPWWNLTFSFRPLLYGQFLDSVTVWDLLYSTTVKNDANATTVDSSSFHLLFGGGIVTFALFCIIFARAVYTLIKRGKYLELAFLTSVMMYSTNESIMLRVENVFIMFAWYLILRYGLAEHERRVRVQTPGALQTVAR